MSDTELLESLDTDVEAREDAAIEVERGIEGFAEELEARTGTAFVIVVAPLLEPEENLPNICAATGTALPSISELER